MIISKTPFRVSLFGGGTDHPAWFQEHGAQVIGTSIDKYCYISCRQLPPFFDHKYRLVYSNVETTQTYDQIKHPAIREILRRFDWTSGLEIHHDGDLPARSGLGSSSAFVVGLLHTLYAMQGQYRSSHQLANEATFMEQEMLNECIGCQDQLLVAHGGLNHISFHTNGSHSVAPLIMKKERVSALNDRLMLFYTGLSRISSTLEEKKVNNIKHNQLKLQGISEITEAARIILQSETSNLDEIGTLLHESWRFKRSLSEGVSPGEVDDAYDLALEHGAIGGKLLGAGGGGFMMLYVPVESQHRVREALHKYVSVPFKFETGGSRIVLYQPNGL